jgi:hypothetical protein
MNRRITLKPRDYVFLLAAAVFLFGCVATTHRSGKTLQPGQFSAGVAYDGLLFMGDEDTDMAHLMGIDARVGVIRGLDLGVGHTWDITAGNDGAYATLWGDAKVQVNNRDNVVGKPILSLGVMKGYVYHENAQLHVTSLPVTVSVPVSDTVTPFFIYRFEHFSDDFFPSEWDEPRHAFFVGNEVALGDGGGLTPVFGVSVGLMNSLAGGEGDQVLVLNAGFSFNTPVD